MNRGAVAAALVLPRFPTVAGRRFDALGFVTIASGLFAVLLALSEGESWGWTSYRVLMLITYSVLSLALFVVVELQVADPLLDIRIFRHRAFTYTLLYAATVDVLMIGDSRYEAERWMGAHVARNSLPGHDADAQTAADHRLDDLHVLSFHDDFHVDPLAREELASVD